MALVERVNERFAESYVSNSVFYSCMHGDCGVCIVRSECM